MGRDAFANVWVQVEDVAEAHGRGEIVLRGRRVIQLRIIAALELKEGCEVLRGKLHNPLVHLGLG